MSASVSRGLFERPERVQDNELRSVSSETIIEHGGVYETGSEL